MGQWRLANSGCRQPQEPPDSRAVLAGTSNRVAAIALAMAMAIPGRLELPTYGLGNRRSIRLSYGTAAEPVSQRGEPCLQVRWKIAQ